MPSMGTVSPQKALKRSETGTNHVRELNAREHFFLMTRSHLNLPIGQMNDFLSEKQADKNELVVELKYDKVFA